jgi:acetamidase/formamidase
MVLKEMMQRREDTVLHPSNLLTGPFYIEDAEVGDTLLVQIKNIKLNRPTA